jgi:phosphatidylglycerophosphatase GEP4
MEKGFRQYFNITGIISSLKVLTNKNLLKPTLRYNSIIDIDLVSLKEEYKIKCIVFDKDNTLTDPKDNSFPLNIHSKLEEFKKAFGKENLAIISNTAGSKDDKYYTVFKSLIRKQIKFKGKSIYL